MCEKWLEMRSSQRGGEEGERIGVLGGTFDPIHLGHLAMARAARAAHDLARVLLVPAAAPPHKSADLTPFHHRMAMAEITARAEAWLEASDIEARRGGVSYTVDTLAELARERPRSELFFIIGEDTIPELPLWRDLPRLLSLARIVAVNRPGPRRSFSPELFPEVPPEKLSRSERDRVEMAPVPIASRELRQAVRAGKPFEHWLLPGVADYIRKHRLYGCRDQKKGDS